MASFVQTAAFYDVLARKAGRIQREGPFLLSYLAKAGGSSVVDLACGTGLHALFLAEKGAEVTACDLSKGMIDYARANRSHPRITYEAKDMRQVRGGPWNLAICLGNSLSLLASEEDLCATFGAVARTLDDQGLFVIQVLNYENPQAAQPRHRVVEAEEQGVPVTAVKSLVPHGGRTLLTLAFAAWTAPGEKTLTDVSILQHWRQTTLEDAAGRAGLAVSEVYGGYDRSAFEPQSAADLVMVFAKNPEPT